MLDLVYKIGELAQLSQVAVRTLRYYDQIGLLVPAHVDRATRYRGYAAEQLEQLNRILMLKDLGLALDEIRALLVEGATPDELRALVERKRSELARRIAVERRRLARVAARLALLGRGALPDIAVRDVAPCWIASVREVVAAHDDCDRLFDELGRHAGARRPRQRGAIWHACAPGVIDCEAFEIVPGPIATRGRVAVRALPAHRVAALIYRGDTDYLPAYRAMRAWIARSGLSIAGPKRELFLRSPGAITEIQFPLRQPRSAP